jgi:hypothetical protein
MTWTSADSNRSFRSVASGVALVAAWCASTAAAPAPQAPLDVARPPAAEGLAGAPQSIVRLTLTDAIRKGVDASHRLAEIRAREAGAKASLDGQMAEKMPQIGIQAGYQRTAHVDEYAIAFPGRPLQVIYPDIPDNFSTRLGFQWPIYTAGRVDALARAASAELDATGKDLLAAQNDLKLADQPRVLGAGDRARGGARGGGRPVDHRGASARREEPSRGGLRAAERCALHRGQEVEAADAPDPGAVGDRDGRRGTQAARRVRSRDTN